ncbi:hypothetical protein MNBD_UNCLBAC01-1469 [hydrothermal vent metagenome]|uniref:Uncharacterized protein n=1 Tax=hydrothermal vent metagenome TaxID=652676 RepID=A0A3B1DFM7_9ZZZZ
MITMLDVREEDLRWVKRMVTISQGAQINSTPCAQINSTFHSQEIYARKQTI